MCKRRAGSKEEVGRTDWPDGQAIHRKYDENVSEHGKAIWFNC